MFNSKENNRIPILPESVRYALKYKEAQFGEEEILSLLGSEFSELGFYLLIKIFNEHPKQKEIILECVKNIYKNDSYEGIKSIAEKYFSEEALPKDNTQGGKSAQFSRMFEAMRKNFKQIATVIHEKRKSLYSLFMPRYLALSIF